MFRKYARTESLGFYELDESGGGLGAAVRAAASGPLVPSVYASGKKLINVRAILEEVADRYKISANPRDYLYEVGRTVTAHAPNENGDAFPRLELNRFDNRRGMSVYRSFIRKPQHVNHETSDPTEARGVILDAHYYDETPALVECPTCRAPTSDRRNRDASGLACRCGTTVKDEFVECLIATDRTKEPEFAEGIRRGELPATSMGCDCEEAVCLVCGNVARAASQFCEHIKGSNKRGFYLEYAPEKFQRISVADAKKEIEARGFRFNKVGFRFVKHGGLRIIRAVEDCFWVWFEEQSRVKHPADPKALTRMILDFARRAAKLSSLSRADRLAHVYVLESQLFEPDEAPSSAFTGKTAARFDSESEYFVVRVNKDDSDVHVAGTLKEALEIAQPDEGDQVEVARTAASSPAEARRTAQSRYTAPTPELTADVTVRVPDGMSVQFLDPNGAPAAMGELPEETLPPGEALPPPAPEAPRTTPLTPEEIGIRTMPASTVPTTTATTGTTANAAPPKARAFEAAYSGKLYIDGLDQTGGFRVGMKNTDGTDQPLFEIPPPPSLAKLAGDLETKKRAAVTQRGKADARFKALDAFQAEQYKLGHALHAEILERGLFDTMKTHSALVLTAAGESVSGLPISNEDLVSGAHETGDVDRPALSTAVDPAASEGVAGSPIQTANMDPKPLPQPRSENIGGTPRQTTAAVTTAADVEATIAAEVERRVAEETKKVEERLRRVYAARFEEKTRRAALEVRAKDAANFEKIARTLRIAARERAIGEAESPLQAALIGVLSTPRDLGLSASGAVLEYAPFSERLASFLTREAVLAAAEEDLESLLKSAAELERYDDSYLATMERDLKRRKAKVEELRESDFDAPISTIESRRAAEDLRTAAIRNNPPRATPRVVNYDVSRDHEADDSVSGMLADSRITRRIAKAKEEQQSRNQGR